MYARALRLIFVAVVSLLLASSGVIAKGSTNRSTKGPSSLQNRSGTRSSHGGVRCWICPRPLFQ